MQLNTRPNRLRSVLPLKRVKKELKIKVKDQGVGLREEELLKVFGRYYRVEQKGVAGLGLGLYIL